MHPWAIFPPADVCHDGSVVPKGAVRASALKSFHSKTSAHPTENPSSLTRMLTGVAQPTLMIPNEEAWQNPKVLIAKGVCVCVCVSITYNGSGGVLQTTAWRSSDTTVFFSWHLVGWQCCVHFCVQANVSVIHVCTFFFIFFSFMIYYRIWNIVPCATQ